MDTIILLLIAGIFVAFGAFMMLGNSCNDGKDDIHDDNGIKNESVTHIIVIIIRDGEE